MIKLYSKNIVIQYDVFLSDEFNFFTNTNEFCLLIKNGLISFNTDFQ